MVTLVINGLLGKPRQAMNIENEFSKLLEENAGGLPVELLLGLAVVGALAAALALYLIWKAFRPRKVKPERLYVEDPVDLAALGEAGPPAGFPALEFYHVPMRLAAIVLAPAGAARELPPTEQLHELFESVVPGMSEIVAAHRPLILQWPSQLSTTGFSHKFFRKAPLPGEAGKGTPWCAVAGLFEHKDQPYLIGLVMRAAADNSFSQYTVEQATKWFDLVRVKHG